MKKKNESSYMNIPLIPTKCAICDTSNNSFELYPAKFDAEAFNVEVFSARRLPDMVHYRIVQCHQCNLVRSDPVIDKEILNELYLGSKLTYSKDIPNLRQTYGKYLRKLEKYTNNKESILEIGCGNGFFLIEALSQGYKNVLGIEPSESAVEQVSPILKGKIYNDVMRTGVVSQKVNVICMFQLFDHIPNPNEFLDICLDTLLPGGLILCFNHNINALSARLLGEKSPIIDIEHTYLYSPDTLKKLFQKHGFVVREARPAWNIVNVSSLFRLFPLPKNMKSRMLSYLERNPRFGQISMSLPIGNLYLIAQKV
jgi:2-polyprenyl-3-methyl-5-hydroxy-6-metoxy-1,4-benzoquinol methylase